MQTAQIVVQKQGPVADCQMGNRLAKEKSARFISLRIKLLIGFTVLFSGVFSVAFYWFYTFATAKATERLEKDLTDTLKGGILGVNAEEFEALAKAGAIASYSTPKQNHLYQRHQIWLKTVHTIEPRAVPYTFIQGTKPREILWIGDIFRIIRPADGTQFRESYIVKEDSKLYDGLTQLTVSRKPYSDPWGHWVSAYGPIKNSEGQPIGGMGIDFNADSVFQVQQAIRDRVLAAFCLTYGTLFCLVYLVSGALTKHLTELMHSAKGIGTGDYNLNLSFSNEGKFPDEMDILAQVFESMVNNIRAREHLLKAIVQDQTESICRFRPNGGLTFVNDAYCRSMGRQPVELVEQNFINLLPEAEWSAVTRHLASLNLDNPVGTLEHQIFSADAAQWKQWTIRALFNSQGQLTEFQAVGRDITERRQAEEALQESEAKYRALVEQIPAVTYISGLGTTGPTFYISPQIQALLGYSQAEWLADPNLWNQQLHPDDRDRVLFKLTDSHLKGELLVQEYRLITRTGQVRWIRDDAVVLADETGQPLFWQGVIFDVTDRKQTEEELQKLNADLEMRVQERTAALSLANEALEKQAHQLKFSLDEKELLLKEVHHRVKNNLQIISSIFSLQSQYIKDPQILSTLTESQNRIRSMALIHEKLYQSSSFAKIDFADYIRSLATSLFSSYNVSANLIGLNLYISDMTLNIDTAIPCGLLINELVSNSLKHAFPDGQQGDIYIHFSVDSEEQLRLIVKDSGIGLPPDLTTQDKGSLGLRLVRALTRQLGGTLEMQSNEGAMFQVTFPKPKERKRF